MSNHDGSYMLNAVLVLLEKYEFFTKLDQQQTEDFITALSKIGRGYDCNVGEILEQIGERIGICYYCLKSASNFEDGLCLECRK